MKTITKKSLPHLLVAAALLVPLGAPLSAGPKKTAPAPKPPQSSVAKVTLKPGTGLGAPKKQTTQPVGSTAGGGSKPY